MKDTFQLRDPESAHMGIAVGAVLTGPGFQYNGVWVHRRGSTLYCDAVVQPSQSVDDGEAVALIDRAKAVVYELADVAPVFSSLLTSSVAQFGVVDDCATSWRPVVKLMDGHLVWARRHASAETGWQGGYR